MQFEESVNVVEFWFFCIKCELFQNQSCFFTQPADAPTLTPGATSADVMSTPGGADAFCRISIHAASKMIAGIRFPLPFTM